MTKWFYIKSMLRCLFGRVNPPKLQTGHKLELVFYSGGKPHFQLSDQFNTFSERGLEAYQAYEEILMRIDSNELKETVKKLKSITNSKEIQLTEIIRIVNNIEERQNFALPPREMIWRMGAIAYIDETESPYGYDHVYAMKKIATWKKNGDVDDFFLCQQLRDLMPLPELSKEIYQSLQATSDKILRYQRQALRPRPSQANGAPRSSTPAS